MTNIIVSYEMCFPQKNHVLSIGNPWNKNTDIIYTKNTLNSSIKVWGKANRKLLLRREKSKSIWK
jgi:hypothetical protein